MRAFPALAAVFLMLGGVLLVGAQPSGELNQEILAQDGQDITFYGATFAMGRGNPLPMNTAFPYGVNDYSLGTGDGGCGTPPPLPDGTLAPAFTADCIDDDGSNELWWYTTAGFIQARTYEEVCGNPPNCDYTQFHNERGQTKDIYFDTSRPANGVLHMSADNHAWFGNFAEVGVGWNWDPGYYPDWTVAATIYHVNLGPWAGDPSAKPDLSPIFNKDDSVTRVAYGESIPFDMWSLDPTIPTGERTVWPIPVEIQWDEEFAAAGGVIPHLNDLIVRWEWYQKTDDRIYITATPVGGYVWNLNGGEDYPNNIVLPVRNPIDVELVFPRFVHDKLVILSVLNTPWGSYDVDLDSIDITIRDASGKEIVPHPADFQEFIDVSVAHSGHYDPINLTWIWDIADAGLRAGEYTIEVSTSNFQGSAQASTTASFTIQKDGSGGDATAGQSGLLSFTDEQFESYKQGAGVNDDASDEEPQAEAAQTESKDSPGIGLPLLVLGLIGAFWRRR